MDSVVAVAAEVLTSRSRAVPMGPPAVNSRSARAVVRLANYARHAATRAGNLIAACGDLAVSGFGEAQFPRDRGHILGRNLPPRELAIVVAVAVAALVVGAVIVRASI
ncbi:MAG: hypothetical protein QOE85_1151 [Actinomycetota bacterium]|nr:hypothetical protein [Actinomycetota bacterium]